MAEIEIKSLADFVEKVSDFGENKELFFRGENRYFKDRIPSIYRIEPGVVAQRSKEYYERIFTESEEIHFDELPPFRKLSELQHFGGLTRFLDITKNSLVALYFAVEKMDEDGYVYIYRNSSLKTDVNDTAYLKASVHFIDTKVVRDFINITEINSALEDPNKPEYNMIETFKEKLFYVFPQGGRDFNKFEQIQNDLKEAQIIIASKSNNRIAHQQGAFITPAFEGSTDYKDTITEVAESINKLSLLDDDQEPIFFRIPRHIKNDLLKSLANMGINAGTVYPDIQHQSTNLVKILTNYRLNLPDVDVVNPNIEDQIEESIKRNGQRFSPTAANLIDGEEQQFISKFHTQKVCMITKNDDYFAGMRADNFVIEIGYSEEQFDENQSYIDDNRFAVITANHKGMRTISVVDLHIKETVSEVDKLIDSLRQSPNFSTTHAIIGRLSEFSTFENSQVEELAEILQTNTQVRWLSNDSDVFDFYTNLIEKSNSTNTHVKEAKKILQE